MIYLFDDNEQGQMSKNYQVDMIIELAKRIDYIEHFDRIPENSLDNIISNASLICIHNSFPTSDFTSRVLALSEQNNIPLVVFSGGVEFTITRWDKSKPNILRLKKDRFYFHFLNFIDGLRNNNFASIALIKLVMGENYEHEKTLIMQDRLSKFLLENAHHFNYESDFYNSDKPNNLKESQAKQNYKDLYELFYFLYSDNADEEFSNFEEKLGANPTAKELYKEINILTRKILN